MIEIENFCFEGTPTSFESSGFSMVDRTPFTYFIAWYKNDKIEKCYYGVKHGKGCHPKMLWVNYFTSSKLVKSLRKEQGEPNIIYIHRVFDNTKDARDFEQNTLTILNNKYNFTDKNYIGKWLNRSVGAGRPDNTGAVRSEEQIRNHSILMSGRKLSEEHIEKIRKSNTGKKRTEEHKIKYSSSKKGAKNPMKGLCGSKHHSYNKHHSGDTLFKISFSKMLRERNSIIEYDGYFYLNDYSFRVLNPKLPFAHTKIKEKIDRPFSSFQIKPVTKLETREFIGTFKKEELNNITLRSIGVVLHEASENFIEFLLTEAKERIKLINNPS